jgi:hypothetical protein
MSEWIKKLAEKYSEVNENQKAAVAKKLAKASASSEKGKAAVTLPKAPFEIPEDIPANERTAFHGAAAGAHKAGKSHFTFQGKKYPVTMKKDTATAIADDVKEAKVDEISVGKVMAYGKAAAKDIEQKRNKVKAALDQPASPKKAQAGLDAMKGLTKRSKGSDMYVNKLTGRSKVKPTNEEDEVTMNPKKEKKEKANKAEMETDNMTQESVLPPVYARIMEARGTADKDGKHYAKAADQEDWNEKEKNNKGAMDMKKDHEGPKMDDPEQSDQMTKAANAAPKAATRKGDNAAGDKKIIPSATPTKGM